MLASFDRTTSTRLIAPRTSLCSCVRAYVARSTVEFPLLDPLDRLNHFPASPLCSITWFVEGETEMIEPTAAFGSDFSQECAPRYVSRILFGGPQTRPTISYNPGPVRAFMLMLYPHALHLLTGIDMSTCVDRYLPLGEVLDGDWMTMAQAVLAADSDDLRVKHVEQFLTPRWQQIDHGGNIVGNWVKRMSIQAAEVGRSVRSLERRIGTWAGNPMRTLRRMYRAEQTFLDSRAATDGANVSWANIAQRAGYADQAHLCRETREITGMSPTQLARAVRDKESYWIYRIWT